MATKESLQKYIEEKERYDLAFEDYKKEVERWNALTPEQRKGENIRAEGQRRLSWSMGFAALACYLLYKGVGVKFSGGDFWMYWGLPSFAIVIASAAWSNVIGLVVRATLFAAITFVVVAAGISLLAKKYAWGVSEGARIAVSSVVSMLVGVGTIGGAGTASAKPVAPKPPAKPT